MCTFKIRVGSCGHYRTTLWNPCDNAKSNKYRATSIAVQWIRVLQEGCAICRSVMGNFMGGGKDLVGLLYLVYYSSV